MTACALALSVIMAAGNVHAEEKKTGEELKVEDVEVKEKVYDLDAVAATYANKKITVGDVKKVYDNIEQLHAVGFEVVYPSIVGEMLKTKVIIDAAKNSNIAERDDVKKVIEEQTNNVLATFYLSDRIEKEKTPKALENMYKKMYAPKEQVKVRHIVVATEQEAKDVLKRLKKGEDFAKIANEISLDKSSDGGDVGFFTKGTFGKEFKDFETMAFNTKKGRVAKKPVKSPMGYHIIKVEERNKTVPPSYDDAAVKAKVEAEFIAEARDRIVKDMMKRVDAKTYDLKAKEIVDVKEEVVKEGKKK